MFECASYIRSMAATAFRDLNEVTTEDCSDLALLTYYRVFVSRGNGMRVWFMPRKECDGLPVPRDQKKYVDELIRLLNLNWGDVEVQVD